MAYKVQSNNHKVRFSELKNGQWSVTMVCPVYTVAGIWSKSAKLADKIYKGICNDWNELGSWVYEMANNNTVGANLNHKMCHVAGRDFS